MGELFTDGLVAQVITLAIGAVAGFTALWPKMKKVLGKIAELAKAAKEVIDVIEKLDAALEDDKITTEEIKSIRKEVKEAREALKSLLPKKVA